MKLISRFVSGFIKAAQRSCLLTLLLLSGHSLSANAQKLQVGLSLPGSAPYIMKSVSDEEELEGIVIDIWDEVVKDQEWEYEWVFLPSYKSGIDAVAQGEIDLFIGATSINLERIEQVDFTQPFEDARVTLMIRDQSPSLWSRVKPFLGIAALSSILILGGLIFIVGNLMWLVERKQNNEHFPDAYLPGVGNGMWFALVTMTTVGYGDRAPVTNAGRWVAGVWMVTSLFTVSSITAGLASAFTVSLSGNFKAQFETVEDLRNAKIAVLPWSASARWAKYYNADITEVDSFEDGAQALVEGKVDGFANHQPALLYFLNQNSYPGLTISNLSIATDSYAFVLPQNNEEFEHDLNLSIIKAKENGTIQQSKEHWFESAGLGDSSGDND
ncbi:MAG: transporter substrate-binding domain-containing protein [Spirulina sp. SIO3F2]|nr:transporter substrate-binding domain-containing protein [Spirulina sp. SIO3F2]